MTKELVICEFRFRFVDFEVIMPLKLINYESLIVRCVALSRLVILENE